MSGPGEGPRFAVGDRVVVEGMEGVVIEVDAGDWYFPYLVHIEELQRREWYMEQEVKPCPSSE